MNHNGFWTARRAAWRAGVNVGWDLVRSAIFWGGFVVGFLSHSLLVDEDNLTISVVLFVAITTFTTLIAFCFIACMTALGQREMDLMKDGRQIQLMEQRLRYLLSEQLLMVFTALFAAMASVVWLAAASLYEPLPFMSAFTFAVTLLTFMNVLRLVFQVWELQSFSIQEARLRAVKRINDEVNAGFQT